MEPATLSNAKNISVEKPYVLLCNLYIHWREEQQEYNAYCVYVFQNANNNKNKEERTYY